MDGGVLETERLMLRPLTPDDVWWLHPVLSDPVAMEFYPAPFTRARTERWIDWATSRYADGFGLWAVVRRDDGRPVGDCGLTLQPVDGEERLEVGYHLERASWGHGYATEAAAVCRDHALDVLEVGEVVSIVHPDNARSVAVARRVHDHERVTTGRDGRPVVVLSTRRR